VSGADLFGAGELARCDCYVVDQKMSAMSGLDLIAQLRDRHFTAPAILIASHPSLLLREQAEKADVSIVEKPLLGNGLPRQDSRYGKWTRLAMCRPVLYCLVTMITMSMVVPSWHKRPPRPQDVASCC
jgi:hypothetical protein